MPAGFDVKALLIISVLLLLFVDIILTLPKSFTSTTATLRFSSFDAFKQKFCVSLGPKETQIFCIKASKELNINVAVVDVNDLGRVKILSTNSANNTEIIKRALISNPAGNANQQTPLVLIRSDGLS